MTSRLLHLVFAFGLALATGCGGGGGETDGGTDAVPSCETPREMCGTSCVNTQSDPSNCGTCGTVCSGGDVCSEGSCMGSCPAGSMQCGGSCADTSSDPDHCGECGNACDVDRTCEGGACECPERESDCDGECVDTDTDTDNCGLCGRDCDPGQSCESGSCTSTGDGGMDGGADDAGADDAGMDSGMEDAGTEDSGTEDSGTDSGTTCSMDTAESNETQGAAYALADFSDQPNTSMTFSSFNLHSADDVDWYRFAVSDDGLDGNPRIDVALDMIPAGSDYDLGVWYECDGTGTTVMCNEGSSDTRGAFHGCTSDASGDAPETADLSTDCSGSNESGIVIMRVESFSWSGSCDSYRLQVEVR